MAEKKTHLTMLDKEEVYRIVAEFTSDTIVLVDSDAVVRYVSPSFQTQTGYSVEEYVGTDAFEIVAEEDRERVRFSLSETLLSRQTINIGYRLYHADGRLIHVETRVKPVLHEDGTVNYVVAVVRDDTARKQTQELLETILDNVNAAVWSTDKDFNRFKFISDSIEKISGLSKHEIIASPIRMHDQIHHDDNAVLMNDVKEALDNGRNIRQEFRWIHVPGETRWGQLIVHPQLDSTGAVERLDGIMIDITDKKRNELMLEESEQRYKSLFENNLDGVFSIELTGLYFVHANRAFEQITGIQPERMTDQCFIGMIYDEDHMAVYEAVHEVMKHGEPRDIECRLADMLKGERIVSITFVPILLEERLNGIHGIIKDITRRKQEERDLIRSEERSKMLQLSLNRLSSDMANVMKVTELEAKLLEEVKSVLKVNHVSIYDMEEQLDKGTEGPNTIRIRIGEKPHPVYLCIDLDQPLARIEQEWLETAVRYVTILYDNLHRTEDLMKRLEDMVASRETPKWMLRLLFRLSEKERALLSSDLHDSVLQDLIIWYRKLESLRSANTFDVKTGENLIHIEDGLLDAIHQIRITCNELRPPFLLKMGLAESLKSLFSYARMFANYEIEFHAELFDAPLHEDQILGVYRIVQELLNNANKHSQASKVTMSLADVGDRIEFSYSDDGVGVELSGLAGSFNHMGIAGIEKRVLSLDGNVAFRSARQKGFHVTIQFPKLTTEGWT